MKKWKLISSKWAFDNPWFKVRQDIVELPNGKIIDDYFVWPEGRIVIIVPVTRDNEFVLVKQYKHAAGEVMIEFPAGYANEGEDPAKAAQRELKEETGYTSSNLVHLKTLTNQPTKIVGSLYVYLATNIVKNQTTAFDENEDIEVITKSYKEAIKMVTYGEIVVTGTIAAMFLACKYLSLDV